MSTDSNKPQDKRSELANITVTDISPPDGSKLVINVANAWFAKFDAASQGEQWTLTQPQGQIDPDLSEQPHTGYVGSGLNTGPVTIKKKKGTAPKTEPFVIQDSTGTTVKAFTYQFVERQIKPIAFPGETYATAPFSGQINTGDASELLGLEILVTEDGTGAANIPLEISATGNLFLYKSDKTTLIQNGGTVTTGTSGTVDFYVANTVAGIFAVTVSGQKDSYGNPTVEGSQSLMVVIADPDGGGSMSPPHIVEMGGSTLDLDSIGSTFTVKIDNYPGNVPAFNPVVVLVNDRPLVSSTLQTMAEFVTQGIEVPAAWLKSADNYVYYMTAPYPGGQTPETYESIPLGPFTTVGAAKNAPLPGVERTYPAPALAPNISIVNQSAISGGLQVFIDNSTGVLKAGDKIFVTGYANGWDGTDPTHSRATTPSGYPKPLVVTAANKDSLSVWLDQGQLSNFGQSEQHESGSLLIDYYVQVGGTGPKHYSKYKSGGWSLQTA